MNPQDRLHQEIQGCTCCPLHEVGHGPVPPAGVFGDLMVVGEAPGRQEDVEGNPFIGPSGALLWETLGKIGLKQDQFFVANTVCCWPNGSPSIESILACRGNLFKQVTECKPKLILALGRVANISLSGQKDFSVTFHRAKTYPLRWASPAMTVFPTLHPAAILRNRSHYRSWKEDLIGFYEMAEQKALV